MTKKSFKLRSVVARVISLAGFSTNNGCPQGESGNLQMRIIVELLKNY